MGNEWFFNMVVNFKDGRPPAHSKVSNHDVGFGGSCFDFMDAVCAADPNVHSVGMQHPRGSWQSVQPADKAAHEASFGSPV